MSQQSLAFQDRQLVVRRRVHIVALLRCRRHSRTVVIADYSHDGLRLVSTSPAPIGQLATVQLLSGHLLPVQVMWVAGPHIGVRFLANIQAGHPVMLALGEAVREYEGLDPPENAA